MSSTASVRAAQDRFPSLKLVSKEWVKKTVGGVRMLELVFECRENANGA